MHLSKKTIDKRIDIFNSLFLEEYEQKEKPLEKTRKKFVSDYSVDVISRMDIWEYVSGLKTSGLKNNYKTFCYRIELELKDMGDFRGARVPKFGVYYSVQRRKLESDVKRFGADIDIAFADVKKTICTLLQSGKNDDYEKILSLPLYKTYKYKILSVYYPNKYMCIFNENHVDEFLEALNIQCKNASMLDKQKKLMNWRSNNEKTKQWSNYILVCFLYSCITIPSYEKNRYDEIEELEKKQDSSIVDYINKYSYSGNLKTDHDYKPKKKPDYFISNGVKVYKRSRATSQNALNIAGYKCERNNEHTSFERKLDNKPYMEPHHLVPMSAQDDFDVSLDVTENIVCLCSNCHNEIHYGVKRKVLIEQLYNDRKNILAMAKINISLDELLKYYDIEE